MKTKKPNITKNSEELSDFEEMLMWTSYRYCIGRHTYVTSMAYDIAKHYYDRLSENRRIFTAEDIRSEIADKLRFASYNFDYDWSVPRNERKPMEHFIDYLMAHNLYSSDDIRNISKIEVYKKDGEIVYDVSKHEHNDCTRYSSDLNFSDLLPWMDLASLFDTVHHKIAVVEFNGKVEEHEVFESYVEESEPIPDQPGYYRSLRGHYVKCYKSVERFKTNGYTCGYIDPEYIKEIKEI